MTVAFQRLSPNSNRGVYGDWAMQHKVRFFGGGHVGLISTYRLMTQKGFGPVSLIFI